MWAIVDCDNCYCSCERVFRPDLNGKPVVVLSNNDGCVIARSAEAKAMGIKMGLPYYQLLEQYPQSGITAFSSNYTLYGDMSSRIMTILRDEAPDVIQYSIDEAFLDLRGMDPATLKQWGEALSAKIRRWTGMPVSIGIAPTKTLAKVASKFAKKYKGYNKCCMIATDEQRRKALALFDVADVWGVGFRNAASLDYYGVRTALDYAEKPASWIRSKYHVTGERTWKELNGMPCIELDDMNKVQKKSIMTSRSFPGMIADLPTLRTHVANYAVRCSEKLRRQKSHCQLVTVFVDTNHFRDDLPQYGRWVSAGFATPTSTTQEISALALRLLEVAYREGYHYKRAGVMVSGITSAATLQPDLFTFDAERRKKLESISEAIDHINARLGSETVVLASQQYPDLTADGKHAKFSDAIKRALKSPDYTTDINAFKVK